MSKKSEGEARGLLTHYLHSLGLTQFLWRDFQTERNISILFITTQRKPQTLKFDPDRSVLSGTPKFKYEYQSLM